MNAARKGMLLVISGPAGAGKGTLIERLRAWDDSFEFSVSCTTRPKRYYETDGVQYHFIDDRTFDDYIARGAFLEYAVVHDRRYGTLLSEVEDRICSGKNVILDIDVQGGVAVMNKDPECVSVFVYPPSFQDLREHLIGRGSEDEEEIEKRLRNAHREISEMGKYRYLLLNDKLEQAFEDLQAIVRAERMRPARYLPVIPENRE